MRAANRDVPGTSGGPDGLLRAGVEVEREGVDAVALVGGRGPIVEDVAKVAAARLAHDFGAHHAVAVVGTQLDRFGVSRLGE